MQDAVQSTYWNQPSTTLFPCPVFFRLGDKVYVYSFMMLSDDSAQDNAWVQHALRILFQTEIPAMLRRVGAAPMTRVSMFTDNCGKQFKCSTSFGFVGDCAVHVVNEPSRRLHIEAHYYGACHGKSLSDSEGAVVKTFAKNQVVNERIRIMGSSGLYEQLKPHLDFELREATADKVGDYSGKIGTGQTLMTHVSTVSSRDHM